eukprot:4977502-Pyramimonas_sp.AAC.1
MATTTATSQREEGGRLQFWHTGADPHLGTLHRAIAGAVMGTKAALLYTYRDSAAVPATGRIPRIPTQSCRADPMSNTASRIF